MANPASISFVTLATKDGRPIFHVSRLAELFIDTLLHYRLEGRYKLHAYLILPTHVYLLLTPQSIPLDNAVALIQQGFTYRVTYQHPTWEPRFTTYSVQSHRDLETLRTYLHQLPVRAGLAPAPELYPYSSAYRQAPTGPGSGTADGSGHGPVPGPTPSSPYADIPFGFRVSK